MRKRAVALLALLAACGGGASKTQVRGSISIVLCTNPSSCVGADQTQAAIATFAVGKPCNNNGAGFSDITPGAPVIIRNEKGSTIATGSLSAGVYAAHLACRFPFTVQDVPDAKTYVVEVAHRGGQTFTKNALKAKGYTVDLELDNSN